MNDTAEETLLAGRSPLHSAVRFGKLDAMELAMQDHPDVNAYDAVGYTPLMSAVYRLHTVGLDTVEWLLAHGADPNKMPRNDNWTALYQAIRTKNANSPAPRSAAVVTYFAISDRRCRSRDARDR